jgi:NAD(P)-dependent dehydrogenase (short-subunit alcohol dehydrogenase family)
MEWTDTSDGGVEAVSDQAGKVALVTGANKGIGLETAKQLGELGITVLVGARDLAKGEQAVEVLRGLGVDAWAIKLDVNDPADRAAAAGRIEREFGKLDILVNNAGVLLDARGRNATSTTPEAMLRETFDTNFFATVALTQTLLPLLKKSPAGRIVNLSSVLASLTLHATKGSPVYNSKTFAYDASKAALNSFTIHLAHELRGTKVKVNSAHPGWVKTEMGGEGASMEIVDGAKTSVQLATLDADGPSGGYFHMGEPLPW